MTDSVNRATRNRDPIDDIIIRSRRLASAIVCFAAVATFIILPILGVFG